jgi:hypothetical protein
VGFDGVTFITNVLEIASLVRKLKEGMGWQDFILLRFAFFAKGR